jgi:hypothetical protein
METMANTPDQDDGWVVSPPDAEGMNADVLSGLAPQFESWSDSNLHAALIVRHGKLVYETLPGRRVSAVSRIIPV